MHIEKPYCQTVLYNSDVFVGGYPITKYMAKHEGDTLHGGASRLEGLVVPVGLILDNNYQMRGGNHNYNEDKENIEVMSDDDFNRLLDNVIVTRNPKSYTKKRIHMKPNKQTRSNR